MLCRCHEQIFCISIVARRNTFMLLHSFFSNSHSLIHSVKNSGKLATPTPSLLWQKCLEFRDEKTFHNIIRLVCMHCPLTVLALILLYGGHCFSVWLPSKVTHGFTHYIRLSASHNNVPHHTTMLTHSIIPA